MNINGFETDTIVYMVDKCSVICGLENGRWHLSIANLNRLPTWEEIKAARNKFIPPDVFMCVPMPPEKYWLNLHPNCLHIWQIKDELLIDMWKEEGQEFQEMIKK